MDEVVQEKPGRFSDIPIIHWLMLAVLFAGFYIFVLMRIDASKAPSLEFRHTSETDTLSLASNTARFSKPSPFGKPVRQVRASSRAFRSLGQVAMTQSE